MTTQELARNHDVIIVGGGIGGSTLAAILARHGVRVLMVEASGHPRFAIGDYHRVRHRRTTAGF